MSRSCDGCIRFVAHADDVPLLGALPDIRCHRRACLRRRIPLHAGGPTKILVPTTPREERCLPEDRDAFHRHDTRRSCLAKGWFPPAFAPALSLTPPTRFPHAGESALIGHCKVTVRSPARSVTIREYRHLCDSLERSRLGLTTQARHRARPTRPSAGTVCPARTDADRSA
jgi:hypothetical protein